MELPFSNARRMEKAIQELDDEGENAEPEQPERRRFLEKAGRLALGTFAVGAVNFGGEKASARVQQAFQMAEIMPKGKLKGRDLTLPESNYEATKHTRHKAKLPGTSENHLGTAVDIDPGSNDEAYRWLYDIKDGYEYPEFISLGFITTSTTEPLHFRYVSDKKAIRFWEEYGERIMRNKRISI